MFIIATLLAITPIDSISINQSTFGTDLNYTKKKRKTSSGAVRKFSSCKAARKAGYTHMRRGQPGYSGNLDRDGDGIACDKVK
jgi:hypothetical protein